MVQGAAFISTVILGSLSPRKIPSFSFVLVYKLRTRFSTMQQLRQPMEGEAQSTRVCSASNGIVTASIVCAGHEGLQCTPLARAARLATAQLGLRRTKNTRPKLTVHASLIMNSRTWGIRTAIFSNFFNKFSSLGF